GQADAELVLKQLPDGTEAPVAEVVDVVRAAHAVEQVDEVVDGGDDVGRCDVLDRRIHHGVGDHVDHFAFLFRREDLDRLQPAGTLHGAAAQGIFLDPDGVLPYQKGKQLVQGSTVPRLARLGDDLSGFDI